MANRTIRAWVVAETSGSLTPLLLNGLTDMELQDAYANVERLSKAVRREFRKRKQIADKRGNEAKRAKLARAGV